MAGAQTAPQLLPYTSRLVAGGGTAVIASGATCPVSGYKSLDAYGDGCLATEIEIGNTASGGTTPGARGAVSDANGNVFFTDYVNALVRRVDAITGIVSVVAGGGTTAAGPSIGLLGTAVKLSHPAGITINPLTGDLYFSDTGNGQVFKVAATGGFITTTGVISLVAGNASGTYGYAASNATTTITAATQGYLRAPYGIAFDGKGDLFIVDEYTEAILVVNTNATGTNTVNNVAVASGTIWKIAGSLTANTVTYCTNGTSGYGCNYGLYTENGVANGDEFDSTYSVTVGPDGTVYAGDEYYDSVFKVSPTGVLSTFSGIQNSVGTKPTIGKRASAGTFGIGSIFGVASDTIGNVYITDASSGAIWRVDAAGLSQYVIAGGAATVCSAATDTYGDGCPATQATFGHSGTGNYATATLPGPGIYAVSVDAYADLFVGDTETNLVREVASGTQFGVVGANQPTDIVDIHFAAGDSALAGGAYSLTSGATNFALGTAKCTTNSDNTTDCLLPVTATPTTLGAFTGTLKVVSTLGASASFPLSGYYAQSPTTRLSVTATSTSTSSCTATTIYPTTATINLTATLTANGPSAPGGSIIFSANGTPIAPVTGVPVTNLGTSSAPVYGATLATTFPTAGNYTITAVYSGDTYFKTSTTNTPATLSTSAPAYSTSLTSYQQSIVVAGQTGLYSFTVAQNVYTGTISFTCSGLPSGASCVFSPPTLVAAGCSTTSYVALSILTQKATTVAPGSFGGRGTGRWQLMATLMGFGLVSLLGLSRRRVQLRHSQLGMVLALLLVASGLTACGKSVGSVITPATPSGTYTVTVSSTGTGGGATTFTVPLIIQ